MNDTALVDLVLAEVQRRLTHGTAGTPVSTDRVPVGVSARHVHLSKTDLQTLFGPGASLTKRNSLYQPWEFAAEETVSLVGPRSRILPNVRVLGPLRQQTQVELARTDAIFLGIDAPVRMSGELRGSAPLVLVGPVGAVTLTEGAILAQRHVHANPSEAQELQLQDNDIISLEVPGERGLIYHNVQVRVKPEYRLELHLDTDEANAAGFQPGVTARIVRN